MLCMPIMSNAAITPPQTQSSLYNHNLLTKEKLLYRGDIEDLWAAIEELRGAVFHDNIYRYMLNDNRGSWYRSGQYVRDVAWTSDGRFLVYTVNPGGYYDRYLGTEQLNNGEFTGTVTWLKIGDDVESWELCCSPRIDGINHYITFINEQRDGDPLGNRVLLYRFNESSLTHITNLLKTQTELSEKIQRISWSPDGSYLALAGSTTAGNLRLQIFACDPNNPGNEFTAVTSTSLYTASLSNRHGISALDWNSNNILAVSYYEEDGDTPIARKLKLFSFNGTSLTEKQNIDIAIKTNTASFYDNGNNRNAKVIAWAPNGLYLALILHNEKLAVYSYDSATNTFTQETETNGLPFLSTVNWSPDSQYLAIFYNPNDPKLEIYNFNVDRLTNHKLIKEREHIAGRYFSPKISWSLPYQGYSVIAYPSHGTGSITHAYRVFMNQSTYELLYNQSIKSENRSAQNKDTLETLDFEHKSTRQQLFDRYMLNDIELNDNYYFFAEGYGPAVSFSWSSDGRFLLYANVTQVISGTPQFIFKIFEVNENGLVTEPLETLDTISIGTATWIPESYYISILDNDATTITIYAFDPLASAGSYLSEVTSRAINIMHQTKPVWSTDGRYFACFKWEYDPITHESSLFISVYSFNPHQTSGDMITLVTEKEITTGMMFNNSKLSWSTSNIITASYEVESFGPGPGIIRETKFFTFNASAEHADNILLECLSIPQNYDFMEWNPDGKHLILLNYNESSDPLRHFSVSKFDQENNSLSVITTYTSSDSNTYNSIAWDSSGEYIATLHDSSMFLTFNKFEPLSKNKIITVKETKTHPGGRPTLDIAWSKPYQDTSHIVISKYELREAHWGSYYDQPLKEGNHHIYSMRALAKTLNNNLTEKAIEVSAGSTLFDFKASSTFNGEHKTYVFSATNQQLINVAPNQTVSFKNIIMQNFNFNTINLQENTSLFFDNQTTLALDGNQYEINRTYTFRGNCTINGNNSTLIFGPQAGFFIDKNATLLLQNITIKGLSDEQIRCMDCTSTVSFSGSVDFFMDNDYYFKHGRLALTPASHVNINNEYEFIYQSPCASIIGSAAMLQMTRNATFSYDPQDENRDLIQFTSDDGIFSLKGATLVSSATGMRLTYGTFKINGEHNYLYSSGTTLSDSIMLGNGIYEDNLLCQFEGGNIGIINGRVVWANVEEPTP